MSRPLPRRAGCARARPALGLLCLFVLLAPTGTRAEQAAEPWFPLERPGRWGYGLHRDHSYRPESGPVDRTFRRGLVILQVLGAGEGESLREVREVTMEEPIGPGAPASRTWLVQQWSSRDGLLLHESRSAEDPAPYRYEPPLRFLPANPEPGDRWRVGRVRSAGATALLTGEVLGYEDVTEGDRTWKRCLKVRWSGELSGSTDSALGPLEIRSGRTERLAWLARGIGAVREVTITDAELVLPEEGSARTHEVVTRRLISYDPGA